MAVSIGSLTDMLLLRTRQSGGVAFDEDFAIEILTTCQLMANIALKRVITSESFATTGEQLIYPISDLTASAGITSMVESNRELDICKQLSDFSAYETNWFRNVTGTRFEAWCQLARDYFVLYPAKAGSSSLTIYSIKSTTISTDYTTDYSNNLDLPDEDAEIVLKLSELVLLSSARKPDILKTTLAITLDLLEAKGVKVKSPNSN